MTEATYQAFTRPAPPFAANVSAVEIDPLVEDLWPLQGPEFTVSKLRTLSEESIRARFSDSAALNNLILNKWEFAHGKTILKSFPWRLSVPFVTCNAQCEFCAAWQMKGKSRLDDLMQALLPVIRHSYQIDLVGWGEPLIHPQFREILEMLGRECDREARLALTTNGVKLAQWVDDLLDAKVREYAISLHSTKTETHQDLMGFGPKDFDSVIQGIRKLASRKVFFPELSIELVLVVTKQNLAEIPEFIKLGEQLGVDKIHLRTLMPMGQPREGLDYHRLPPYLHEDFLALRTLAKIAIANTGLQVRADPETWSRPLFSPDWESRLGEIPLTERNKRQSYKIGEQQWELMGKGERCMAAEASEPMEDLYGRTPPHYCPSPYTAFYINGTDRRVIPCVYMHKVPQHDFIHFLPSMSFADVWNSPAMVATRASLRNGPLMSACLKCPSNC